MGRRIDTEFALNALLMALWRRQPKATITAHSDQGSQFTSHDFTKVLLDREIRISMDGKAAWRDNVFVERLWL